MASIRPIGGWRREKGRGASSRTERFASSRRIQDQVRRFVEKNFSEQTLGLQLRGSDKFDFGMGPNLARKVLPEEYFPHIDRYLLEHPECSRIFVATDQRQWLGILERAYPDKIISFSARSLSDTDENRFHDAHEKAARGIEVLADVLLLSHCSFLLKCHAGVGEMALVLNPKLEFLDLNYANQPFQVRSRLLRGLLAPSIALTCSIWSKLAENGMALAEVVSVEEDRVMVNGSGPRLLNTKEGANQKAPRPPLTSGRFVSDMFDWGLRALSNLCFEYDERNSAK